MRFFAPSTTRRSESGHPGFASPGTFRPRGFHLLDGFLLQTSSTRRSMPFLGFKADGVQLAALFCSRDSKLQKRGSNHGASAVPTCEQIGVCPSLGHAGSHPSFERHRAPGTPSAPLTWVPLRNTGRRAQQAASWQRPSQKRSNCRATRVQHAPTKV